MAQRERSNGPGRAKAVQQELPPPLLDRLLDEHVQLALAHGYLPPHHPAGLAFLVDHGAVAFQQTWRVGKGCLPLLDGELAARAHAACHVAFGRQHDAAAPCAWQADPAEVFAVAEHAAVALVVLAARVHLGEVLDEHLPAPDRARRAAGLEVMLEEPDLLGAGRDVVAVVQQLGEVFRPRPARELPPHTCAVKVHQHQLYRAVGVAVRADQHIPAVQVAMDDARGVHSADHSAELRDHAVDPLLAGLAEGELPGVPCVGGHGRVDGTRGEPFDAVGARRGQRLGRRHTAVLQVPAETHLSHRVAAAKPAHESVQRRATVEMLEVDQLPVDRSAVDRSRVVVLDLFPGSLGGGIKLADTMAQHRLGRFVGIDDLAESGRGYRRLLPCWGHFSHFSGAAAAQANRAGPAGTGIITAPRARTQGATRRACRGLSVPWSPGRRRRLPGVLPPRPRDRTSWRPSRGPHGQGGEQDRRHRPA